MKLKIKEFADFCNISVRALHLYDEIDLFHPSCTDEATGYRYYSVNQILELNTIISFKKVGFTLNEIKEIKQHGYSKDEIIYKLKGKIEENRRQIEIANYNIENMEQMLNGLTDETTAINIDMDALRASRIACLENDKLENELSQIIWL